MPEWNELAAQLQHFHFLRPLWLLTLLLLPLIPLIARHSDNQRSPWMRAIDPGLLRHLLDQESAPNTRTAWYLFMLAWAIAGIALAGPAWQKLPQPVYKDDNALVVVMDLSLSMEATDIKPSRLTKASHKLIDLLDSREQGQTALIVYAGDAHTVSPLTDDTETIKSMVPALSPLIMPALGSNPEQGIELAMQLFSEGGIAAGRILLVTDGIEESDVEALSNTVNNSSHELSILAVGTEQGGPIPIPEQGFLKERGQIVVAKLPLEPLRKLASDTGGRISGLQLDDSDIRYLLNRDELQLKSALARTGREVNREFDKWNEEGPWLLLVLAPLAALAFRRGWLMTVALLVIIQPAPGYALDWRDLWQTPDQQGNEAFNNKDYAEAADAFADPGWKGSATYRAGDFETATDLFSKQASQLDNTDSHYNHGNALARSGRLEDALAAYDKSLERDPENEDAAFNRKLIEELLKQQNQQQNQDSGENGEQNPEQNQDKQQGEQQSGNNGENQQQDQNPENAQQDQSKESSAQDQAQNQAEQQQSDQQSGEEERQNQANNQPEAGDREQDQTQAGKEQEQADGQQEKPEPAQADKQQGEEQEQQAGQQSMQAQNEDPLSKEQRQAMNKWLRRIPDDPAGLLRRKFDYQYKQRQLENQFLPQDENEPKW